MSSCKVPIILARI